MCVESIQTDPNLTITCLFTKEDYLFCHVTGEIIEEYSFVAHLVKTATQLSLAIMAVTIQLASFDSYSIRSLIDLLD